MMTIKYKSGCFVYLILIVLLLLYLGYGTLRNIILENRGIYTSGIVYNRIEEFRNISTHYSFVVNGQKYFGKSTKPEDVKYLTKTWIKGENVFIIGDTIDIVYDKTNPANNKSARDFDRNGLNPIYLLIIIPIFAIFVYYWRYKL
jgi:hypothetical protein